MKFTIHDYDFEASESSLVDIAPFDPESPEADLGPHGMVEEMIGFVIATTGCECLIDVGALSGIFSLMFATRGSVAYAFEPSPRAFPTLVENCLMNQDRLVVPIKCFAGETKPKHVGCKYSGTQIVQGSDEVQLEQFAIDEFHIAPDAIKIDVEGYEGAVLRGAEDTIRRHRPIIFLEVHLDNLAVDDTPDSLMDFLDAIGYRCFTMESYKEKRVRSFGLSGKKVERVICRPT